MTQKKRHTIRKMESSEAPALDENLRVLYEAKGESRLKYEGSASSTIVAAHQSTLNGQVTFSATGSPTVSLSFPLAEPQGKIVYAQANACDINFIASVTDITATSVTIAIRNASAAGNISANSTESITVFWQVVGSNP